MAFVLLETFLPVYAHAALQERCVAVDAASDVFAQKVTKYMLTVLCADVLNDEQVASLPQFEPDYERALLLRVTERLQTVTAQRQSTEDWLHCCTGATLELNSRLVVQHLELSDVFALGLHSFDVVLPYKFQIAPLRRCLTVEEHGAARVAAAANNTAALKRIGALTRNWYLVVGDDKNVRYAQNKAEACNIASNMEIECCDVFVFAPGLAFATTFEGDAC